MLGIQRSDLEAKLLNAIRSRNVDLADITVQLLAAAFAEIIDQNNQKIETDLRSRP